MTDKEKLDKMKKLADAMYTTAQHLTTDASGLRKAMEEYHQFIITEYNKREPASRCDNCEGNGLPGTCASISSLGRCPLEYNKEPASEDFESEWKRYCDSKGGGAVAMNIKDVAKHFTEWQKTQDQQTIELAEEHAMLAGMMQERERIMKDAVEGQVERGYCEDGISEHFEVFAYLSGRDERFKDLSDGQSVKVIIIKE